MQTLDKKMKDITMMSTIVNRLFDKIDKVRKKNEQDRKRISSHDIASDDGAQLYYHGRLGYWARFPMRWLREHDFIKYNKSFTRKKY